MNTSDPIRDLGNPKRSISSSTLPAKAGRNMSFFNQIDKLLRFLRDPTRSQDHHFVDSNLESGRINREII